LLSSLPSPLPKLTPTDPSVDRRVEGNRDDVLGPRRRVHLIGIGGQGMHSLARLLKAARWQVSGSDQTDADVANWKAAGITVHSGHAAENIPTDVDEVVYSGAVPDDNAELFAARQQGIPTYSYAEMVGRVTASRDLIAVAGTHGKSTTTAMVAEILIRAQFDPTVICGAEPVVPEDVTDGEKTGDAKSDHDPAFRQSGRFGRSTVAVAEACEYRRHFLELRPRWAAITGMEPDHFDCYRSVDELATAFAQFAAFVHHDGVLLVPAHCLATTAMLDRQNTAARIETFSDADQIDGNGNSSAADWQARDLTEQGGCYQFLLEHRGRQVAKVRLQVFGRHNVRNALVAAAMAHHAGASFEGIQAGLAAFGGIRRRLEPVDEVRGISIWTDYAHHPTEISASLAALRQKFPNRRICVIFQPHQESRTRHLLDPLARSLKDADIVAVTEIFRARESSDHPPLVTAADLATAVRQLGTSTLSDHDLDRIKQRLAETCRPGDVLVTMGAGDLAAECHEYTDWI